MSTPGAYEVPTVPTLSNWPADKIPTRPETRTTSYRRSRRSHPQRWQPWTESNNLWECLTPVYDPPTEYPPARPLADISVPESGIVSQLPTSDKTWDNFSGRARNHDPPTFVGGSVLLGDRANTCDVPTCTGTLNPALATERDPILEGDDLHMRRGKKAPPKHMHSYFELSPSQPDVVYHRQKGAAPKFDSTRAGVRTDMEKQFRPSLRRIPLPPSWSEAPEPVRNLQPAEFLQRDVILQLDDEFDVEQKGRIRTFQRHLRQSRPATAESYRPLRRIIGDQHPDSAIRVMHYNLPPSEEEQARRRPPPLPTASPGKQRRMCLHASRLNSLLGQAVIQYRFSEGICPEQRLTQDKRAEQRQYERGFRRQLKQRAETQKMFEHYQRRDNHETSIY